MKFQTHSQLSCVCPEREPLRLGPQIRYLGYWELRNFLQAPRLLKVPQTDPICLSERDPSTVRGRSGVTARL